MAARGDLLFVALAAVHAALVLAVPAAPLIAVGVWWNSNTIAHNFIHRPFFRVRSLNLIFSACQSVLMGIPQALWRDRHLAHHVGASLRSGSRRRLPAEARQTQHASEGRPQSLPSFGWQAGCRVRWSRQLLAESALVCALWIALAAASPEFFVTIYLPGYLAGLALCAVQGHYEHAGATTSHYGRLYNLMCFNDGFHVEHHAYPGVHWTALPRRTVAGGRASRWPPLLRWIDTVRLVTRPQLLDSLERLVLRWPWLQRFVLDVHRNAFRVLLRELPPLRRVAIVGGGLFPRTAIVLRELVPGAEIVVIDASRRSLDIARRLLGADVAFEHARFSAADSPRGFDLIVIPLAFQGDRAAIYRRPPAAAVLVHDWLWRRRGHGCLVSIALLKRLNLVRP